MRGQFAFNGTPRPGGLFRVSRMTRARMWKGWLGTPTLGYGFRRRKPPRARGIFGPKLSWPRARSGARAREAEMRAELVTPATSAGAGCDHKLGHHGHRAGGTAG